MFLPTLVGLSLPLILMLPSATGDAPPPPSPKSAGKAVIGTKASKSWKRPPPAWARDARWYYVSIPRFCNGRPANDPPDTLPFGSPWPPNEKKDDLNGRSFGGDLQGVQSRLAYLKDLGINGLVLSSVFETTSPMMGETSDFRHVDPTLSVKTGTPGASAETLDAGTWRFSPGDRVFLKFLEEAHKQGFKVLLEVDFGRIGPAFWALAKADKAGEGSRLASWFGEDRQFQRTRDGLAPSVEEHLFHIAEWWMDPNHDGNPSEGIDGWVLEGVERIRNGFWNRFALRAHKLNPEALLIGHVRNEESAKLVRSAFHGRVSDDVAQVIRRFFGGDLTGGTLETFFADLETLRKRNDLNANIVTLSPLGGPGIERMMTALTASPHTASTSDAADRWRLAMIFQHLYLGAPMTYYGDEIGMTGGAGPPSRGPMWWFDAKGGPAKSGRYRGDFFAIMRLLNVRRGISDPMRHGDARPILLDAKRKLFALARTLPGNEAILVMNYGNTKHRLKLPVGTPGQLIGILSPQVKPGGRRQTTRKVSSASPTIPRLLLGGSRQHVAPDGTISLWIKPHSIRIVLVKDAVPG